MDYEQKKNSAGRDEPEYLVDYLKEYTRIQLCRYCNFNEFDKQEEITKIFQTIRQRITNGQITTFIDIEKQVTTLIHRKRYVEHQRTEELALNGLWRTRQLRWSTPVPNSKR